MIIDAHTHHQHHKGAIINAHIDDFSPAEGLYYSLGIHPWDLAKINVETAIKHIETFAAEYEQVIAIGECGLDSLTEAPINVQIPVFERQIAISERLKKPLIIHCVHCVNEILRLHRKYAPEMPWIMHGFRSNANVLRSILEHQGIYVSIGEKFNADAVRIIPDERLLIETDESSLSIEEIASRIAPLRNQTTQHILDLASQNNKAALFF